MWGWKTEPKAKVDIAHQTFLFIKKIAFYLNLPIKLSTFFIILFKQRRFYGIRIFFIEYPQFLWTMIVFVFSKFGNTKYIKSGHENNLWSVYISTSISIYISTFTPPPHPLPPPQREVRTPLESNPYEMIRSINFKPVSSYFQKKLVDYINNFKLSENLIISADKTANLYEMTPEQYKTTLINK